ncbi:hypothetical protein FQA39_LY12519 [Lamprigera yunnana]|nr:hypothetical protein FQA39_LY12519 [Lamprigera yunnana]
MDVDCNNGCPIKSEVVEETFTFCDVYKDYENQELKSNTVNSKEYTYCMLGKPATRMATMKRNRGSNYSKEEQLILLEEINKYKKAVENKSTNKISCHEKLKAWRCIKDAFNAKVCTKRTMQQLQSKYENLKTEARKAMLQQKWNVTSGSGGPPKEINDNPIITSTLELMYPKTVVGWFNMDNDSLNGMCSNDTEMQPEEEYNPLATDPEKNCSTSTSIASTSEVGFDQISSMEDKGKDDSNNTQSGPKRIQTLDNWRSNYASRRLKRPINQKLRPTRTRPFFEEKQRYYQTKRLLLEAELEMVRKKDTREEEKHKKKMILLDLEIERKKKELMQ